jgi:UbiD family decarboxylase
MSDILIPATTELVLEGFAIPNSSFDDCPFAEYPGVSSLRTNAWIIEITCITMRKSPIFQSLLTGMPPQEDSNLCAVGTAAYVYQDALSTGSEIKDVSVYLGNNVFDTVVSLKKRNNSEVNNLIYRLLGNNYVKTVTVVDEDINVHSHNDVLFAQNTRMQPNRDVTITGSNMFGASLDPSAPLFRSTSKMAFDCTIPIGNTPEETDYNKRRHEKADVPGVENIKW